MTGLLTAADIVAAMEADDVQRVVDLFEGRDEAERRKVAPEVIASFRRAFPDPRFSKEAGAVAVVACATLSELKRGRMVAAGRSYGAAGAQVLIDRRPPWLEAWVAQVFERIRVGSSFMWARTLFRAGVIPRPESDGYILAMILGISSLARTVPGPKTWADVVRSDPELLEHEVWRLFEVEGRPREASLTSNGGSWFQALMQLVAAGDLSRSRLIDATLGALAADFSAYNMRWYFDLYKALDPTEDERRTRADRYLQLLRSREPTVVKFGVAEVKQLVPSGCVDPDAVADAVAALLPTAPQATSLAALKLLGRVAGTRPSAVRAAAEGLANPSAAVQKAALEIAAGALDAEDDDGRNRLRDQTDLISPRLRDRLVEIAGVGAPDAENGSDAGVPIDVGSLVPAYRSLAGIDDVLVTQDRVELPRRLDLDPFQLPPPLPDRAISPIVDTDELIQTLAELIESADDPAEIERALDGLAGLAGQGPDDLGERTGPLRKRALQLRKPGRRRGLFSPEDVFCQLVLAWTDGTIPDHTLAPWWTLGIGVADFLHGRMVEVGAQVAVRKGARLLAMPTHAGGWIDAVDLAHRVIASEHQEREPGLLDAVQAVLRLSPWGREEALTVATDATSEVGRALRYALNGPGVGAESDEPLWVAARRAKDPYGDDEPGGPVRLRLEHDTTYQMSLPDVTYVSVGVTPTPPSDIPKSRPTDLAYACASAGPPSYYGGRLYVGDLNSGRRWAGWVWPLGREVHYANALNEVSRRQDLDEDDGVFLEPLLDPDEPFGEMAVALVWAALGAKSAGTSAAAADVLVAGIDDGRLDGAELGAVLATMLGMGVLKPTRLAARLSVVAATSPLHVQVVRQALEDGLDLGGRPPLKNLHSLLEVFLDLTSRASAEVRNPGTRQHLESLRGPSKSGKLASGLLAARSQPDAHRAAAVLALNARIARAQRWEAQAKRHELPTATAGHPVPAHGHS